MKSKQKPWFQWTFPVKLGRTFDPEGCSLASSNPGIPAAASINRALCSLCALEHSILGPLHLPFGTTLFVRCSK